VVQDRSNSGSRIGAQLLIAGALALSLALLFAEREPLSAQSRRNLKTAAAPSLAAAIESYPRVRPPVYPLVLYGFASIGIGHRELNALFLWAAIAALAPRGSAGISSRAKVGIAAAVGIDRSIASNLHQATAEPLFALCSALVFAALRSSRKGSEAPRLLWIGSLAALASLTRFFGLLWLLPLAALGIASEGRRFPLRRQIQRLALFAAPGLLTLLPYLVWLKLTTGSLSGMDRLQPRELPLDRAHWRGQTDLLTNLQYTLETLCIDFFSPFEVATHAVVERARTPVEIAIYSIAVMLLVALAALTARGATAALRARREAGSFSFSVDATGFALSYLAATLAVWTLTNNDPIYSRFLFPIYPFFLIAIAGLPLDGLDVRRAGAARACRLALVVLYGGCNAIRCIRLLGF
jgi:hypothetical protein